MPRKLKVYQTSLGFFDLAIAAPSMKAALEAWGAGSNLFHQGVAKESDDRKVIDAAMEKPGTILQRPVGTDGPFREHADLPTAASLDVPARESKSPRKQPKAAKARKIDEKAERRAAVAFEREQKRRERQRQKEEAAAAKAKERRKAAMEKAGAALEAAEGEHKKIVASIEKDREAVDRRAAAEEERWEKAKDRLERVLRNAGR
jgi:colicin import membrane protein